MTIKFQSAVLFVQDVATSRRFYEGLLGQTVEMDFGLNVGYVGGFAIWEANHAHQMIFGHPPASTALLGRGNVEVYFESEDLGGVADKLAAANVPVIHPICEQPWGQRVLRVYDPDGHIVEIAEPMPVTIKRLLAAGMTVEAVAQRTAVPLDIIQQIAAAQAV